MLNDWQVKHWEWWKKRKIDICKISRRPHLHQCTCSMSLMVYCSLLKNSNSRCFSQKEIFHMFHPLHVPFQTLNISKYHATKGSDAHRCGYLWWLWITKAPAMLTTVFKEGQRLVHNFECNLGQKRMHESVRRHAHAQPTQKNGNKPEQKQRDGDNEYCGCICFSFSCGCSGLPFAPSLCSATTGGPHIFVALKSGKKRCDDKQMSWIKCSSELFTKEMVDSCCTLSASKSTYNISRGASVWLVNYLSSKSWKKCYYDISWKSRHGLFQTNVILWYTESRQKNCILQGLSFVSTGRIIECVRSFLRLFSAIYKST